MAKSCKSSSRKGKYLIPAVVPSSELRRMAKAAKQDVPVPAEGKARCISNEGIAADLEIGDVVYLRELPGTNGQCVVLRDKKMPLVGIRRDRFELLR